jgi:hypothetical protein
MLSGIWDLKWKRVKNLGQRSSSLFISAMKTAKLACLLCITCWSKHPSTFAKIVEGSEIYNFAYYLVGHFSSRFWSYTWSNRASLNYFGAWNASTRTRCRRHDTSACCRTASYAHAEAGLRPQIRSEHHGHGWPRRWRPHKPWPVPRGACTQAVPAARRLPLCLPRAHVATPCRHVVPMSWLHLRKPPFNSPAYKKSPSSTPRAPPPAAAASPLASCTELPCRPNFPAAQPPRCFSWGPWQLPESRIARPGCHLAGAPIRSGQYTAAPWCPLRQRRLTPTPAADQSYVTPRPRSSPYPALSGEHLARISAPPPPPCPRTTLQGSCSFQGVICESRAFVWEENFSRGSVCK